MPTSTNPLHQPQTISVVMPDGRIHILTYTHWVLENDLREDTLELRLGGRIHQTLEGHPMGEAQNPKQVRVMRRNGTHHILLRPTWSIQEEGESGEQSFTLVGEVAETLVGVST